MSTLSSGAGAFGDPGLSRVSGTMGLGTPATGSGGASPLAPSFGLGTPEAFSGAKSSQIGSSLTSLQSLSASQGLGQQQQQQQQQSQAGKSGQVSGSLAHLAPRLNIPRLDALACRALAAEYHHYPALDEIPPEYLDNVIAMLDPSKIDFAVACQHIRTEKFWKRLAVERWPIVDPKQHGNSWKRLFVERHLSELIESYYPSKDNTNFTQLLEQVEAGKHFVHTLQIKQLLSNLDLAKALGGLPHLTRLELRYTTRSLGMDYDPSLFGLQLPGAMSLARLIAHSTTLTHLTIRESRISDEACHIIARGLADNDTITHIDLSHNKIGDLGAAYLARAFAVHPVLTNANLSNNSISAGGARAIAAALRLRSESLEELNLSLNLIGDAAGAELLESLVGCTSLTKLRLSGCALGTESARGLALLIQRNPYVEEIDVSCNDDLLKAPAVALGNPQPSSSAATSTVTSLSNPTGANAVAAAHQASQALLTAIMATEHHSSLPNPENPEAKESQPQIPHRLVLLDLRRTKVTDKVAQQIEEILGQRRAKVKQSLRKAFQAGWDSCE